MEVCLTGWWWGRADMTDRRIVRIEPSYLHVCHAAMTEVEALGLDPSYLHPDL
jgi:hypothetical protein